MDRAHAFALLGLPPNATPTEVRQQYRILVRRWHPDQYGGDPTGLAEATEKTRLLNEAVSTIEASMVPEASESILRPYTESAPQFGRHLTPKEIEEISNAVGTESWAGFMGRLIVVLTPFYFGVNLLGRRGTFGQLYSLTEYERALAYGAMALGVGLGWWLFRRRQ